MAATRSTRSRAARLRWWALGAGLAGLALAAGCSTLGYYAQSIGGHLSMMRAARPIADVVDDPTTAESLRQRLLRAQQIRTFATQELALPDNTSYLSYADVHRPYVVWNVFAAPELSLELKRWCYPVVGCAGYRGYFDLAAAEATAAGLRAEGYEVHVSGVPAYSTLGWLPDPLLNTFIGGSEGQLASLLFHELAHQVVYVGGDTTFNESFATAVEREGVRRWLAAHGDPATRHAYAEFSQRRSEFIALLLKTRRALEEVYGSRASDSVKRENKRRILEQLRADYAELRAAWSGFKGYDRFFSGELTNAHLASVGAYNDLVPAFEALLAQSGGDLARFYNRVRELAERPRPERDVALQGLMAGQ